MACVCACKSNQATASTLSSWGEHHVPFPRRRNRGEVARLKGGSVCFFYFDGFLLVCGRTHDNSCHDVKFSILYSLRTPWRRYLNRCSLPTPTAAPRLTVLYHPYSSLLPPPHDDLPPHSPPQPARGNPMHNPTNTQPPCPTTPHPTAEKTYPPSFPPKLWGS